MYKILFVICCWILISVSSQQSSDAADPVTDTVVTEQPPTEGTPETSAELENEKLDEPITDDEGNVSETTSEVPTTTQPPTTTQSPATTESTLVMTTPEQPESTTPVPFSDITTTPPNNVTGSPEMDMDFLPTPPTETDAEEQACWWRDSQKLAAVLLSLIVVFVAGLTGCARRKGYCKCGGNYEDVAQRGLASREYQQNNGNPAFYKNDSYDPL